MSEQTVGLADLEAFLQGKCGSPQMEAATIWTLLVYNSSLQGDDGLSLNLSCDVCGEMSGKCGHNSSFNEQLQQTEYTRKQEKHWRITVDSLRMARHELDDMEIRLLGSPEKPRPRRQLLYAWIDSL